MELFLCYLFLPLNQVTCSNKSERAAKSDLRFIVDLVTPKVCKTNFFNESQNQPWRKFAKLWQFPKQKVCDTGRETSHKQKSWNHEVSETLNSSNQETCKSMTVRNQKVRGTMTGRETKWFTRSIQFAKPYSSPNHNKLWHEEVRERSS